MIKIKNITIRTDAINAFIKTSCYKMTSEVQMYIWANIGHIIENSILTTQHVAFPRNNVHKILFYQISELFEEND